MQEALLIPEIRPERFLDPSAGTGMFISTLKDVPEIHCFEKDRLTGRILSSLYPKSRVTIDGFSPYSLIITATSMLFLPISRLGIPEFMTGTLTGVTTGAQILTRCRTQLFLSQRHGYAARRRDTGLYHDFGRHGLATEPSVREWLVNHANLVSTIRLPDNLFTDAGTEVGSDLIVLQKNTRKSELTEKERNFIETRIISDSIHINNSYADLDHIIHTSVSIGKNMYGQPAMNFIHEGGIGGHFRTSQAIIGPRCGKPS